MTSAHFEDFSPDVWAAPPATYPDLIRGGPGRWFSCNAGMLWTDDSSSLGLETDKAIDWDLVAGIRATLAENYAMNTTVTEVFNRMQEQLDPDEWFEGDLTLVMVEPEGE